MFMNKRFKPYDLDQRLLLPPDIREWLPEGHLASFITDVVAEMDLSAIYEEYEAQRRGQPPYDPRMMVALLVYAYCMGKPSSRKIERATYEEVPYRVIAGDQHPDHDTIADFRKRHLEALAGLFVQVLLLCQKAGLVKLGHVSLDGTKVKANASKHKAMSYKRMCESEKKIEEEVKQLLEKAETTDQGEDEAYGKGQRGDDLPAELARRDSRLAKIREAKAALEEQAREKAAEQAESQRAKIEARARKEAETGKKVGGRPPQEPEDPDRAVPDPKAQRNFTDPESRIMKDGATKSFEQAYNAQAVVDDEAQIIVASDVTQETNDKKQLKPMLEQVESNLGQKPEKASADAGYYSDDNVTDPDLEQVDLYIPPNRQKHGQTPEETSGPAPADAAPIEQMRRKLKTPDGRAVYKMRKAIVEPVFGQIKEARGFRRFSFRGLRAVAMEWDLVCLTHNLLKLFRAGVRLQHA
jgi:transposase